MGLSARFSCCCYIFSILMRLIQNAQTAADMSGSLINHGRSGCVEPFRSRSTWAMVIGLCLSPEFPLPLMSYGGSFGVVTFLALGTVMNVRMRRFVN